MKKKRDPYPPSDLIDKHETAAMCGVSPYTVAGWAKRNVIPSYKVVGARRYSRSEILDFLAKGRRPAVTPPSTPTNTKGKEE
ncbi:helix-turn-helix domain-containing protein [Geobacter sp. FeAm09]|uniref:helix-turn-helix domain-containing protein n=1 Tax=Geobacter sp. FeAm09 TaxID=2597769 RepID=UPI0011ED849D|nr:helix-turn-helix domain-containing protein [Geobacter sp. FeAm09]QEM69490.1 helix-turn-helix domain-containing protein [Geobacter sp. FeAm09]